MKNEVSTETNNRLVIRDYTYNKVTVTVKIDFDEEHISLVNGNGDYPPKNWLFAKRSLGYMAGWQAILDAMKYAISEAEKELREVVEEREKARVELVEGFGLLNAQS